MSLRASLSEYQAAFQGELFPALEEALGPLPERYGRFVQGLSQVKNPLSRCYYGICGFHFRQCGIAGRWTQKPVYCRDETPATAGVGALMKGPLSSGGCFAVYSMFRSPPGERFGVWCCQVGTRWHRSRLEARTQLSQVKNPLSRCYYGICGFHFRQCGIAGRWTQKPVYCRDETPATAGVGALIRAVAGGMAGPSLDPACLRAPRSGGGTHLEFGILQPNTCSVTRPPAQRRPRPAGSGNSGSWGFGVSGSGDAGAGGHETGVGIAPQGDQELAGHRHDHDPADPSPGTGGAGLEPLAQRTVGLEPHPSPRHLHELGSDPGGPVTADPLVTIDVAAGPRGRRQAGPARELAAVVEPAVEDLVRQQGRVVRADPLEPGQRRDRRVSQGLAARRRAGRRGGLAAFGLRAVYRPHRVRPRSPRSAA